MDIGCNCGDITIPLSFLSKICTGVDGKDAINRMRKRVSDYDNIEVLVGNFLNMKVDGYYDCILIYSVLMYLDSYEEKSRMIQKACNLLKHGGRMLVGDIVNVSVKERLANSKVGQRVDAVYRENIRMMTDEDKIKSENILPANYILNDRELCNLLYEIRSWGYESFLLPQDYRLPFGYSRQDILITTI